MALNSVTAPFFPFADASGQPIEGGYIYIGQPGLEARSAPKASFFDAALTIPTGTSTGAAVRTSGGYPVSNGSAAIIYVDGDFSTTVTDRNGVLVFSRLNRAIQVGIETTSAGLFGDGNLAGVGIGFGAEPTTGLVRTGAGTMQIVGAGTPAVQTSATGVTMLLPATFAQGGSGYNWAATVTTTGGTFADVAIPLWATEIVIVFTGVSLSGTDDILVQLGDGGGIETTGYFGSAAAIAGATISANTPTNGFAVRLGAASDGAFGTMYLTAQSPNVWNQTHVCHTGSTRMSTGAGGKALSAVITTVRVTVSGANTFDAGSFRVGWR